MCRRFLTGEKAVDLADAFGIAEGTAYRILQRYNVPKRQRFSLAPEREEELRTRYEAGESGRALAKEFGITHKVVARVVTQSGLEMRSPSEAHRIYSCNHSFFDRIDSEEKAYWLGFLSANGCVVGNAVQVNLSARDRDHLLRLKEALRSTHPVTDEVNEVFGGSYHRSRFTVTSPELVSGLAAHGVDPRKSLAHEWPGGLLSTSLLRHYLRGYVDGDGGFYFHRTEPHHSPNLVFSFIGSPAFCAGAQRYLIDAADLPQTKLGRRGEMRTVHYSGDLQVARIYRLLYDGATVWLPRKRDKVADHVQHNISAPVPKLRQLRLEHGLTQRQLGEKSGLSAHAIWMLENRNTNAKPENARKLAHALRVDPSELYG